MFIHDSQNAILKAKQQGREEGEREQAIAHGLLDILDLETISQKTGLSITKIESLN